MQIFRLDRPVFQDRVFKACADGPACLPDRRGGKARSIVAGPACRGRGISKPALAERKPAGNVIQRAVGGVAEARAQRAENIEPARNIRCRGGGGRAEQLAVTVDRPADE